ETEAPESPHTVASPTLLPHSTPPTLVPILRRTARIVMRVPPAMSPGISVSIAEVADMPDSTFRKRFRSSYESSPSSSPPDLPSRKRYRGTSELVEDEEEDEHDKEGDDEREDEGEDEKIEESLDSNSVSKDAEDKGPTVGDEDLTAGDEGLAARDEVPGMGVESLSLGGDEVVPRESERPERVSVLRQPTLTTWIDLEDGIAYIDVPAYPPPAPPAQTPPSPEWSSGLLPIYLAPSIVPSTVLSPMIPLTVSSLVASSATAETERFLTELGARVEMQGELIRDHTVRLGSYHLLCFREERRARMDFAEIVDSMRGGNEPKGDV
nr:hypothetical protein [Tanacetum cinerariifolium]